MEPRRGSETAPTTTAAAAARYLRVATSQAASGHGNSLIPIASPMKAPGSQVRVRYRHANAASRLTKNVTFAVCTPE